jgi:uncharacterized membrane protein YgcG
MKAQYDEEQKELADKAKAKTAYDGMKQVYDSTSGSIKYTDYDEMHKAYGLYEALSEDQRKYFPADFLDSFTGRYRRIFDAHTAYAKAHDAQKNAERAISGISHADEDDMSKVKNAYTYYNNLSFAEQAYFSEAMLEKMGRLKREAEEDHEHQEHRRREEKRRREEEHRREEERRRREAEERHRREEEERHRRERSMMNHSSHPSGGSFGGGSMGHGGHSTGGGAGKHF